MSLESRLRAVIDDPDADAPRVEYESVCAASGDAERAEFIRLQMETTLRCRAGRDDEWDPALRALDLLRMGDHRDV